MGRPERQAWHRLAALYRRPLRELQDSMTARDFVEVLAFQAREPQGDARLDYWGAHLLAALRCLGGERVAPRDCLPDWWSDEARGFTTGASNIEALLMTVAAATQGADP